MADLTPARRAFLYVRDRLWRAVRGGRPRPAAPVSALGMAWLDHPGCPACRQEAEHDPRYFFWYLAESYLEAPQLDALTRSVGFCRSHAAFLAGLAGAGHPVALVYRILAERVRRGLSRRLETGRPLAGAARALVAPAPCPACRSRREAGVRASHWVGSALSRPDVRERYGHPSLLCLRHLAHALPRTPSHLVWPLLSIHAEHLSDTLKGLPTASGGVAGALAAALGADPGWGPPPGGAPASAPRDPVREFRRALGRAAACVVCEEVGRAWAEWVHWLEEAVGRGEDCEDLLPRCPDHAWAVLRIAGPTLGLATAAHVLRLATVSVERAGRAGSARARKLAWPGRGPALRAAHALDVRAGCPLCRRLGLAEARALALLAGALEDGAHRRRFGAGGRLCLRHLGRALGMSLPHRVERTLLGAEVARLGLLVWELEEAVRKAAWQWRPERLGAEATAWRRALSHFAGTLPEPVPAAAARVDSPRPEAP